MAVTISGTDGIQGNLTGQASELAPKGINSRTLITDLSSNDMFLFLDSTDQTLKRVDFNSMQPPGTILRVVQNVINQPISQAHTGSLTVTTPIPSLSAGITPQSSTNNIMVDAVLIAASSNHAHLRLERSIGGAAFTPIATGIASGSRLSATTNNFYYNYNGYCTLATPVKFIDAPNTTQEVRYRFAIISQTGITLTINVDYANRDNAYNAVGVSTITLWEIKA